MYKVVKRDCPMFGIGPYLCEFICDTASDISTLPTSISEGTGGKTAYDNQKCASGSIVIVAENGSDSKQYMLNNQDIWCPYSVAVGNSGGSSSESSITVDFALSETSESPVANKTITAALNEKANSSDIPTKVSELENDSGYLTEHPHNNPLSMSMGELDLSFGDTFYIVNGIGTDNNGHVQGIDKQRITLPSISIENSLNINSNGLLTNKTITAALNEKVNVGDIPTELPANGGNADTVGNLKIAVDTITANSDAGGYVWLPNKNRIYISVIIEGHSCTIYMDVSTKNTNLYVADGKSETLTIHVAYLEEV